MTSLRARVIRGRLVVDEPTDLPDGTEVELTVTRELSESEELERVHAGLDDALADLDAGDQGTDAFALIHHLRARR